MIQTELKNDIDGSKLIIMKQIDKILDRNPQIILIKESIGSSEMDKLLETLEKYENNELNLYRGMQQWYRTFPKDDEYKDINPKKPGSEDFPDFAYNENSWVAMTSEEKTSGLVAYSWSDQYAGYFQAQGGIDSSKPVAIIFKIQVGPPIPIAFAMDGEIQIKGPLKATEVKQVMIDDLWEDGHTFREFAEQSHILIK